MSVQVTVRTVDGRRSVTALMGQTAPSVSDGRGGWSEVARPRRPGVVEWVGTAPAKATVTLMLDGWRTQSSVAEDITELEAMSPLGPTSEQIPVTVTNAWPIPSSKVWQVQGVSWDAQGALRNALNHVVRTEVTLDLIEYRVAEVVVARSSPAKRATAKKAKTTTTTKVKTVTVKKGDTLSSIAAKYLGSASKWKSIATLNKLRSPSNIKPGQKLKLP